MLISITIERWWAHNARPCAKRPKKRSVKEAISKKTHHPAFSPNCTPCSSPNTHLSHRAGKSRHEDIADGLLDDATARLGGNAGSRRDRGLAGRGRNAADSLLHCCKK
jgi:hypothetical protein